MNTISHDSEVRADGQQVITACAFIHYTFEEVEKVFLPKRADTKKFLPSIFEIPGGHIEYGEEVVEGLKREVMEEMGMNITVGDPFAVFTYLNEIKGSHSIEVVYFAQFIEPIENITLNPEDHSEYRWVAESELETVHGVISDEELKNIERGFSLLRGKSILFK